MIEKPFARTVEEVDRIAEVARSTGRVAMARGGNRTTRQGEPLSGDSIADDVSNYSV